jgi:hypothetical protein
MHCSHLTLLLPVLALCCCSELHALYRKLVKRHAAHEAETADQLKRMMHLAQDQLAAHAACDIGGPLKQLDTLALAMTKITVHALQDIAHEATGINTRPGKK